MQYSLNKNTSQNPRGVVIREKVIRGTDGRDMLQGCGIFDAGKGDDYITIQGDPAKSTLRFNLGDGKDVIDIGIGGFGARKLGGKIQFGKDVTPDMITFQRDQHDGLIIVVGNNGDQMTITNFFYNRYKNFTHFEFADGTIWKNFQQTETWKKSDLTPVFRGTDGNDVIYNGEGVIEAGKGNDTIHVTQTGSQDTLRFNLGDGKDSIRTWDYNRVQDKVVFGKDVTPDMINFSRNRDDLIVSVGDNGDSMTFLDFYGSRNAQTFSRFEFANGTIWNDIRDFLDDLPQDNGCWCYSTNATNVSVNANNLLNQTNSLISAMSSFAPQAGEVILQAEHMSSAATILAASAA